MPFIDSWPESSGFIQKLKRLMVGILSSKFLSPRSDFMPFRRRVFAEFFE